MITTGSGVEVVQKEKVLRTKASQEILFDTDGITIGNLEIFARTDIDGSKMSIMLDANVGSEFLTLDIPADMNTKASKDYLTRSVIKQVESALLDSIDLNLLMARLKEIKVSDYEILTEDIKPVNFD